MSQTYPDLPYTTFPNSLDQFTTWLNIVASDGALIQQYHDALQNGNTTLANTILNQIPNATQKIIRASDLNQLSNAILSVERFYSTDIEPYINELQESWIETIEQFRYIGAWSSGTTYQNNNIVSYTTSGLTLLFVATGNPPVGTPPSNTNYWRVLTIQGEEGPSGEGLSYRQAWDSSYNYSEGDVVTDEGILYMALQANQNSKPSQNPSDWQVIMRQEMATYPIQDTEPAELQAGGLWFNTAGNPTRYYHLTPLSNPATASQIASGYQAYDANGNVITGTA